MLDAAEPPVFLGYSPGSDAADEIRARETQQTGHPVSSHYSDRSSSATHSTIFERIAEHALPWLDPMPLHEQVPTLDTSSGCVATAFATEARLENEERLSMHVAVMHLTFDPDLAPLAASAFSNDLLPKVKATAGFRGGFWLDPSDGKGLGFILFENAEQACQASAPEHWQAPGVTIDMVEIRRVAALA